MQIKTAKITHIFDRGNINEFTGIKDVSLNFKQGEFVTIIGPTGSGKTTFIEHLNALSKPTFGEVKIDHWIITNSKKRIKDIKKLRKKVGVVFQFAEYQLFEETIEKDIIFGPITMGVSKKKAALLAKKYIKLVGLSEDLLSRSPFSLSGGQKRRVALAGILAMEPDFLIFDEPTAGLDPQGETEMYEIFNNLHRGGKTIIIVTHNLDHVLEHSQRTIIFNEGKVVADGSSLDIMYNQKLIHKHDLEAPKITKLVWELENKGKVLGKIKSIEELAKKL